jgi:hypothetical protein
LVEWTRGVDNLLAAILSIIIFVNGVRLDRAKMVTINNSLTFEWAVSF